MPKLPPLNSDNFPPNQLTRLPLPGAEVYYQPDLFPSDLASNYFQQLTELSGWAARSITVYGKPCQQNRQTIFFGEKGTNYRYSGINNQGDGQIPPVLRQITQKVESRMLEQGLLTEGQHFNYWLGNQYVDGTNNIGMHSDDERGLVGPIVSLSFGSERYFDFLPRDSGGEIPVKKTRLNLESGSVVVMMGDTQKNYLHGVPSQRLITSPRINITLRMVKN